MGNTEEDANNQLYEQGNATEAGPNAGTAAVVRRLTMRTRKEGVVAACVAAIGLCVLVVLTLYVLYYLIKLVF